MSTLRSEYQPKMKGRVIRVSYDRKSANVETLTGRIVVLDKGNGDWCGLSYGQAVEITNYNRHVSLFGEWLVVDEPAPVRENIQYTKEAPREVYATLAAEPVRPPMPDPRKARAERFESAPSAPFRDLQAEREDLLRMRRGR